MTKSHVLLTKCGFYCVLFVCFYSVFVLWVLGLAISYCNDEAAETVFNVTVLLHFFFFYFFAVFSLCLQIIWCWCVIFAHVYFNPVFMV